MSEQPRSLDYFHPMGESHEKLNPIDKSPDRFNPMDDYFHFTNPSIGMMMTLDSIRRFVTGRTGSAVMTDTEFADILSVMADSARRMDQ